MEWIYYTRPAGMVWNRLAGLNLCSWHFQFDSITTDRRTVQTDRQNTKLATNIKDSPTKITTTKSDISKCEKKFLILRRVAGHEQTAWLRD